MDYCLILPMQCKHSNFHKDMMMRYPRYLKFLKMNCSAIILIFSTTSYATQPILNVNVETKGSNIKQLNPYSSYKIDYKVTNKSRRPHSAQYVENIAGVTQQNAPDKLNCDSKTILSQGQSCVLRLFISAPLIAKNKSTEQKSILGGPNIAVDGSTFLINQPSPNESLAITVNDAPIAIVASVSSLALSVNDTNLNSALTGTPRVITFTNEGSEVANNVVYLASPSFPTGTTTSQTYIPYSSSNIGSCAQLYPGDACAVTITPGSTATTTATTLTASSGNYSASSAVSILTYGSLYQTGYVFSIDDSTNNNVSVGGTIVAQGLQATTGIGKPWSPASETSVQNTDYYAVCGIYQSTLAGQTCSALTENYYTPPHYPSSYLSYSSCNGATDGACNTFVLVGAAQTAGNTGTNTTFNGVYPSNGTQGDPAYSSAGLCRSYSTTDTDNTVYQDWYLPSICELGYQQAYNKGNTYTSGCSQEVAPAPNDSVTIQNIQSSLLDPNPQPIPSDYAANFNFINLFWSSTEFDNDNCNEGQPSNTSPCAVDVWYTGFNYNHSTQVLAVQNIDNKGDAPSVVICVRAITQS
jgi:hypothetical protein